MAARLGFLRAERGTKRVDLPERRGGCLAVQLPRLREVRSPLVEVFGREQTAAFADGRRENRRVDAEKPTLVEKIVDRLLDLIADGKDRPHAITAQPEVAVIEQEIDSVLFRLNGVVYGAGPD